MKCAIILKNKLKYYRSKFKSAIEDAEESLQINLKETEEVVKNLPEKERTEIRLLKDKKDDKKIKKISSKLLYLRNDFIVLNTFKANLENAIIELDNLIQSYDNDKVKNQISSISKLMKILNLLYSDKKIDIITFSDCLGMALYRNYQLLLKNRATAQMKHQDLCRKLGMYYNEDGSFTLNDNIEEYYKLMTQLEKISSAEFTYTELFFEKNKNNELFLAEQFTELLKDSNTKLLKKQKEKKESEAQRSVSKMNTTLDYNSLRYIREYYKKGKLIALPNNMQEFYEMLDRSGIGTKEKKNILNLINKQIKAMKKDSIFLHLDIDEINVYNQAKEILSLNQYNDPNYYILMELLRELDTALSFYDEFQNPEDLLSLDEEKSKIIEEIRKICLTYKNSDLITNNLIFLSGNDNQIFFEDDLNIIDKRIRKNIINLLKNKVIKENQQHFRKVMIEHTSFQLYEVFKNGGKIFFLELSEGIFLILGADTNEKGYQKIKNRLFKYQEIIKNIIKEIEDSQRKENLLIESENILNRLTNKSIDESRTRKRSNV